MNFTEQVANCSLEVGEVSLHHIVGMCGECRALPDALMDFKFRALHMFTSASIWLYCGRNVSLRALQVFTVGHDGTFQAKVS